MHFLSTLVGQLCILLANFDFETNAWQMTTRQNSHESKTHSYVDELHVFDWLFIAEATRIRTRK